MQALSPARVPPGGGGITSSPSSAVNSLPVLAAVGECSEAKDVPAVCPSRRTRRLEQSRRMVAVLGAGGQQHEVV
jgi:hypothetical protein